MCLGVGVRVGVVPGVYVGVGVRVCEGVCVWLFVGVCEWVCLGEGCLCVGVDVCE
jgi:hypothetical protein